MCDDDDECINATQICGDRANCTNTNGSYYCTCLPGYMSTDREHFTTSDGTHCIENSKAVCHLNSVCISANTRKTLSEISTKKPLEFLQSVKNKTTETLTPVDVISYVDVMSQYLPFLSAVNDSAPDRETLANTTISVFVDTVNNFLKEDEITVWNKIPEREKKASITKLLHIVENVALSMSQNFRSTTQLNVNASDIAVKIFTFDSQHIKHEHPHVNIGGDFIKLSPKKKTEDISLTGSVSVVFLKYNSISSLLNASDYSEDELKHDRTDNGKTIVISQIIGAAIHSSPPTLYELERITFTLKHLQVLGKAFSTVCAFWNYTPDTMQGHWSTDGCEHLFVNSTHTSCSCNHLTHFAILMSPRHNIEDAHYNVLTRITQLGIIVSLICLSMCIFTFFFFSEIQSTRTTIHKNLCCSLFLAELLFLIGISITEKPLMCSIVAGLLHYFFLCAFAWMCIEGIHLYLIVVGVIYNKGFLHRNFYIFGYGSAAVVVGISAILGYKYYGTENACWLSTENNFIWSFIGPACLIILVNLLAFGVIIYKVFQHTAVLKPEVSCYENIRSCARGALALLFLLGATWMFGVLHVVLQSLVTAYLFTVFNVFQGMFIFIFLCILSRKIQKEYYRMFKNVPCCFLCLR